MSLLELTSANVGKLGRNDWLIDHLIAIQDIMIGHVVLRLKEGLGTKMVEYFH